LLIQNVKTTKTHYHHHPHSTKTHTTKTTQTPLLLLWCLSEQTKLKKKIILN